MNECDGIMNKFAFVCSGYMMWLCVGGGWFLAHCRTHTQPTAFIIRPSHSYKTSAATQEEHLSYMQVCGPGSRFHF